MVEDKNKVRSSRYKPEGYEEAFPTDMGETSMQVASLLDLGREAYQKESYDLAMKYYNRALDMEPTNKEAKFLKRKTMLSLARLLEGKTKLEDDDEVDKELDKAVSKDLAMSKIEIDEPGEAKKMTTGGIGELPVKRHPEAKVYRAPRQDHRRSGGRVYAIPDTDSKFNNKAKDAAYRSGESYVERRETRLLIIILLIFIVGVFMTAVYFGWITF
jgi:tetratricopeptide (TPR) repeat protein